jgi:hypothetical protein
MVGSDGERLEMFKFHQDQSLLTSEIWEGAGDEGRSGNVQTFAD